MNPKTGPTTRRGFTLIELLVVISIIAIIAGLVVPSLMNAQGRAYVVQCMNNLRGIQQSAFMYSQKNTAFPIARGTDPAAHDSLNVLLKSSQGRNLDPDTFVCPEGEAKAAQADDDGKFILDESSLSYTWVKRRTKTTKNGVLSSDKYVSGVDYDDGIEHSGHESTLLVVNTIGKVSEIDLTGDEASRKVKLDDSFVPVGLTR